MGAARRSSAPTETCSRTLDDLALSLVNQLRLEVGGGQRRYQTDPALELMFLRARGLQHRRDRTSALEAAALFEQIVARDPGYAPAVAARARSLGDVWRLSPEFDAGAVEPRLEEAALEAIRLDPLLPDAQAALGTLHTRDRQWASAEAAFQQALEIDPSQGSLYVDYAVALLLPLGRVDDALDVLARARAVAPLSLDVRRSLAHMQVEAGLYDEAIKSAQWVLQQDPDFPFVDAQLGRALILSGRPDDALPILSRKPDNTRSFSATCMPSRAGATRPRRWQPGSRRRRNSGSTPASGTRIAPSRRSTAR